MRFVHAEHKQAANLSMGIDYYLVYSWSAMTLLLRYWASSDCFQPTQKDLPPVMKANISINGFTYM